MVSTFITAKNNGGTTKVGGRSGRIKEMFIIVKFHTVFELYDTEEAAIAGFTDQE